MTARSGRRVAILLAAGSSRRFGRDSKLRARIGGERLIDRALRIARAAPAGRLIVVTGREPRLVRAAARGSGAWIVHAADHAGGMGESLARGLEAVRPGERLAFLFLGDMPRVPPAMAARLLRALRPGDAGVRPVWRGRPGHPVLLRLPLASVPRGDAGPGRGMRLRMVAGPAGCVADVDTRRALARLHPKVRARR